ncbi:P-II family nitrogen regulator [Candidatus Sumerlaeota bacterium]|nr:P-II family nitrogen regulator [Candidatus Sumerlaeota bacterium]
MQKLECIIRPYKLDEVRAALLQLGVSGLTLTEVRGLGRQRGHTELFRGSEYASNFLPKIKVEVVVPSRRVDEIVAAVIQAAQTGQAGDGKIFLHPIAEAWRVRTGEQGEDAV